MTGFLVAVVLVVAFVWGQMTLLRPSRRDQRLMGLRTEARRLGLHARLLAPPDWYRGDKPRGGLLACYSVLTGDEEKGLPYFLAERLSDGEWVVRQGIKAALPSLPGTAVRWAGLEARANTLSVWWAEEGEESDLLDMLVVLAQLREKLS
ncbi:MAG: hypothetical protein ACLGHE_05105 [Gammaproteobacteria bacterium]